MTTTTNDLTTEFAAALKCRRQFVQVRLGVLGHCPACTRCGGSGHYSRCQMYGTTCFRCAGSGKGAAKLTARLLETVREDVAAGKLQPYIDGIKARIAAKGLVDQLFAVWEAIPANKATKGFAYHVSDDSRFDLIKEINSKMSALYHRLRDLTNRLQNGDWDAAARQYVKLSDVEAVEVSGQCVAILADAQAVADWAGNRTE